MSKSKLKVRVKRISKLDQISRIMKEATCLIKEITLLLTSLIGLMTALKLIIEKLSK